MQNFLSFLGWEAISKSKEIFQSEKFNKIFQLKTQQNFLAQAQRNFLAFQDAINKIKTGGGSREEAQEDERNSNSYYPSA